MFQHEQAILVPKVLTYMSFSNNRDLNQLLVHERYKLSFLMSCTMPKEPFCLLVHCSADAHITPVCECFRTPLPPVLVFLISNFLPFLNYFFPTIVGSFPPLLEYS